ncbi:hypothetical protein ACFWWB_29190 [Streptomyces sp. NPDC058690]|uniref:hypothetical protein n=1 Tax=Streptomyces sp. NPDC058690 TaxID=3346600 RepID=UPI0036627493
MSDTTQRVNAWPASDPLVVSVGGTRLHLDTRGDRIAPDSVYNDDGASGGGLSHVFARSSYQNGVKQVVGDRRGTPDVSMSAAVKGGAWVYSSYNPKRVGWDVYVGTSEASPLFAGIVALADQVAGHRLGTSTRRCTRCTRSPRGTRPPHCGCEGRHEQQLRGSYGLYRGEGL